MSSSAGTKYEWLVVVPDKPGTLAKRLEVRPTHFANLDPKVESGLFKMGGAILTEVPKDDKPESMKFCGSTLVVVAESREEVMEALKKDIYSESGVWDLDSVSASRLRFRIQIRANSLFLGPNLACKSAKFDIDKNVL
jgi:uncharacterized protein YciI